MTTRETFGAMPDGRPVDAFTLQNSGAARVRILTLGGTLQSVQMPDRGGALRDVVLGFPDLTGYIADTAHHGALIGRYANRIAGGRFTLDGKTCQLPQNSHGNTLHGGIGFDHAVWALEDASANSLTLSHVSPDGDQGFPGNLRIVVAYTLGEDNTLRLDYAAETDAPTVVNFTNHAYWDLGDSGTILDHVLQLNADSFTPVDATSIPTGEIRSVAGIPFDFRQPTRLRERVADTSDPQIAGAGGIDHNFIVRHALPNALAHAATILDEPSGRSLEVWTTEPGMQVYTGNNLRGSVIGKAGHPYPRWSGMAVETQHYPDSPNEPSFPTTVLRPGERFHSATEFRFRVTPG